MKAFIKDHFISILCCLLLSLLLILWGQMMVKELRLNMYTYNLTTTDARLRVLDYYGWQVDPGSETRQDVAIPQVFDAVWENYNRLQTVCGFDLNRFRGKKAICYTYLALNFPYEGDEPVFLNLLIVDGELAGGDCMSRALDGFMLPLDRRYLP